MARETRASRLGKRSDKDESPNIIIEDNHVPSVDETINKGPMKIVMATFAAILVVLLALFAMNLYGKAQARTKEEMVQVYMLQSKKQAEADQEAISKSKAFEASMSASISEAKVSASLSQASENASIAKSQAESVSISKSESLSQAAESESDSEQSYSTTTQKSYADLNSAESDFLAWEGPRVEKENLAYFAGIGHEAEISGDFIVSVDGKSDPMALETESGYAPRTDVLYSLGSITIFEDKDGKIGQVSESEISDSWMDDATTYVLGSDGTVYFLNYAQKKVYKASKPELQNWYDDYREENLYD